MARSWNIFSIGRRTGDENQLTEMLAWLATTIPPTRAAILRLAFGTEIDPAVLEVMTQYSVRGVGVLDMLLEGGGYRLVVESKLGSTYGSDQLTRYLDWLAVHANNGSISGLMTLTATRDESAEAVEVAKARGVVIAQRRWEELHALLNPLTGGADDGDLSARTVKDFLDMLADEHLVPISPLTSDELATTWSEAWASITRLRLFFGTLWPRIAEAAAGTLGSSSDRGDWFWRDIVLPDGARMAIGFINTDQPTAGSPVARIPGRKTLGEPVIWAAVHSESEQWSTIAQSLVPPSGWRKGTPWYGRPVIWRLLSEVVTGSSYEEQANAIGVAAAEARQWYDGAVMADCVSGLATPVE